MSSPALLHECSSGLGSPGGLLGFIETILGGIQIKMTDVPLVPFKASCSLSTFRVVECEFVVCPGFQRHPADSGPG